MLSRILVDGYKSIGRAELQLKEFTLLSGINSAGKSSIIQALLYMIQTRRRVRKESGDDYVVLGKFADIKNHIKGNKDILFELDMKQGATEGTLAMQLTSEDNVTMEVRELTPEKTNAEQVRIRNVIYLPVDRIGVQKAYDLNMEHPQEIGSHGEYTYSFLGIYGQEPVPEKAFAYDPETLGMSLNNQVNYWLEYLMGFHIRTNILIDVDQVVVMYSNAESNRYYRAGDVGTGVTYIAVLIIAALSCKAEDTLIDRKSVV